MLKLRVVQALYGDCLILVSGTGKRRKYVLVDGGPGGVYGPYLRGALKKINADGGKLDLVVLSHVDDDHVAGLLEFMAELKEAHDHGAAPVIQVGSMWHNGFSKILPEAPQAAAELEKEMLVTPEVPLPAPADPAASSAAAASAAAAPAPAEGNLWTMSEDYSVKQGHQLQLLDAELGIQRNAGFTDGLIQVETAQRPLKVAGMRVWILGPNKANLEAIRSTWIKWLKKQELSFAAPGALVKPDTSETNLSSIMFLAEVGKRRILMTGDGRGDDVVAALELSGLLTPDGTFHVDILKLPHHGSARNNIGKLFDRVLADVYLVSANGRDGNPDRQTLDWLVDAACRQNRDIKIVATNTTPSLEQIQIDRPPAQNHYQVMIMPKGEDPLEL
jgi:hypothetical protein